MMNKPLFGPAGNSDSFTKAYKGSVHAPKWLKELGLDCYEYQCGRGVNVGEDIFLIETEVGKQGGTILQQMVEYRNRLSREKRWAQLDEDVEYRPTQLDRDIVNLSQIRTVIRRQTVDGSRTCAGVTLSSTMPSMVANATFFMCVNIPILPVFLFRSLADCYLRNTRSPNCLARRRCMSLKMAYWFITS